MNAPSPGLVHPGEAISAVGDRERPRLVSDQGEGRPAATRRQRTGEPDGAVPAQRTDFQDFFGPEYVSPQKKIANFLSIFLKKAGRQFFRIN
jgi:hypothetical protein